MRPESSNVQNNPRLILAAHGSREAAWLAPLVALRDELAARHGPERVRLGFLEFLAPSVSGLLAEAARDGCARAVVLPLFIAGGHVTQDLPRLVDEARALFPALAIELLPAAGEMPEFRQAMSAAAAQIMARP